MYLKFCKIDCHSISNLKSNSLYAAVPNQLNDPFEAMCTTKSAKAMYNLDGVIHYHEQVKRYNTRRAIICLVKTDDANYVRQNLLMWSHYADSHRGFCVEYKDSIKKPLLKNCIDNRPIDYKKELVEIDECGDGYELDPIFRKEERWGYEKEERFLYEEVGLHSLGNHPAECINAIYLGCNIDNKSKCYQEIIEFALKNGIKCCQMTKSPIYYELIPQDI